MHHPSRRRFLKTTLATAATVTLSGTKSSGQVVGANEAIRIGIAGLSGRGGAHVGAYLGMPNVRITHLMDPDRRTWDGRARAIQQRSQVQPRTFTDVRTALEDRNLDALSIATPNHWHALMTIWACQAGKDVYVEKPCSHNVHEGRVAVEMARRHNRIVQHGTQNRATPSWGNVMNVINSGQLGRLLVSRGLCYKRRGSIGTRPNGMPPAEVDFNIWLGPAQERAFHTNLVHYNWHWFWDFGNGDIGNQGVHQMDIARWAIRGATLPRTVLSLGGRFGYTDQGETPNTQIAIMDFGQTQLIFEVRGLETPAYRGQAVGNIFHLEGGTIVGTTFYPRDSTTAAPLPRVEATGHRPSGDNFRNFIDVVRSRRREDLDADILEGHYSSALGHLANLSYRLGEAVALPTEVRGLQNNSAANETLTRTREHLRTAGVPLDGLMCRMGQLLTIDAQTERCVNNDAANRLLTREYRRPFTLPANS